jgi:hypothetical protein
MDHDLKQNLAPTRAKGRQPTRNLSEEVAWADKLEWRTNDYDVNRIVQAVIARLDATFREEYGVRLDQLADGSELLASASQSVAWYKQADKRYRSRGIYSHLHNGLDNLLRKRALRLVDQRRTKKATSGKQG